MIKESKNSCQKQQELNSKNKNLKPKPKTLKSKKTGNYKNYKLVKHKITN